MPIGEENPLKQGRQIGVPLKSRYFTDIGSSSVKKWLQIGTGMLPIIRIKHC